MPQPGQKTVTVGGKTLTKLEQLYRKEKSKQSKLSFASFIAESALIELERRNILREAQQISLISYADDTVILKDVRKAQRFIEVQIRNKKLMCLFDDTDSCIHVGFALALPEVRRALDK